MDKINFKNGEVPINDTNLNQMQDNMENGINNSMETISNENGTAIKFPDGTMICTKIQTFKNVNMNNFSDTLKRSNTLAFGSFPVSFIDIPSISYSITYHDTQELVWLANYIGSNFAATKTNPARQIVCSYSTDVITQINLSYTAIGRWK